MPMPSADAPPSNTNSSTNGALDQHVLAPDRFHGLVVGQLPGTEAGAVDYDISAGLAQIPDDALLDSPAQGLNPSG